MKVNKIYPIFIQMLLLGSCLSGCYVSSRKLVHPESKKEVDCSSWGFGIIGAPVAFATTQSCIEESTKKGYVESSNTTEQKSVESPKPTEVSQKPISETVVKADEVKNVDSSLAKLEQLKELKQKGVLDENEYQEKRKKIVDTL